MQYSLNMCGIFGWLSSGKVNPGTLDNFFELLNHRGPDSKGFHSISEYSLIGMTRLSINDLSSFGDQPIVDQSTGISIVLNGEIYNFKKLRTRLELKGHHFRGGSDSEVALRSYIEWGLSFTNEIEGMFAIAIWDPRSESLILARDRFGQKPLYYASTGSFFAFSSEAKALAKGFSGLACINSDYLPNYLAHGYVNNNVELFKNICEVPPCSTLVLKNNKITITKYWNYTNKFLFKSSDSYKVATDKIDSLLSFSIKDQVESSDVSVGVLLSGGIDSAIIAKQVLELVPKTFLFTLIFNNKDFNEQKKIDKNFAKYSDQHIFRTLDYDFDLINNAICRLDVPISDTSVIPLYAITQTASSYVKSCLTGDGADEIFAGYSTYQATKINNIISTIPNSKKIINLLLKKYPISFGNVSLSYKIHSFLKWQNSNSLIAHQNWRRIFTDAEIYDLTGTYPKISEFSAITSHSDINIELIEKCLIHDANTWLLNDILVKSDRISMANGLELRSPYLEKNLVEYTASLPSKYKLQYLKRKKILKHIHNKRMGVNGYFSKKRGFGSPISQWILKNADDFAVPIRESNLFDQKAVERLFTDHSDSRSDNGQKIYALFVYSLWSRNLNMVK